MKRVTLKTIALNNFRRHKDLKISFNDVNVISGDNEMGKSTIFDAFIWLLFGKDQFDRKDHEIIPIIDNKRVDRIDSEVEAIIDFDGREMKLKRVLHQKWVRRRGQSEEVFDGCETLYYINDVPLKAGEYKARIDLMIEETVFKLITNTSAFLSLHWQKQREFLFQIAGTVSDEQIAASNPNFNALLDSISGKSLSDYKKELTARKKKLTDDLKGIQPRIDQTYSLMPKDRDFSELETQIKAIDEEIAKIDLQLSDRSKAVEGQYNSIQEKKNEIHGLKSKISEIVNNAKKKAQDDFFADNQKREEAKSSVLSAQNKLSSAKVHMGELHAVIESLTVKFKNKIAELDELRSKWIAENEKEYQEKEGCLVCPLFNHECSDATALEMHNGNKQDSRKKFMESKERKLAEINAMGKSMTDEKFELENKITTSKSAAADYQKYVEKCDLELSDAKTLLDSMPEVTKREVIESEILDVQEIQEHIKWIEESIGEVKPVDNSDFNSEKAKLIVRRDSLKSELSERDLIAKYKSEIASLEKQASEIAQQIADVERSEFHLADFNRAKIEECDSRINGLFKVVKFQLFDQTIDGNEFEACIPTNKLGIPISVTNTADRINAGLDIINTLSEFYNVSAPIFCDNAESVNNYIDTNAQMVFLRVTKEKVLTVN
jgi:DNA repair exonuclease SbcCD ATPase subunit